MSENDNSVQMTLNVFGFLFVVLGLGLDGGAGILLIGLAIALFISALVMAAVRGGNGDADNG